MEEFQEVFSKIILDKRLEMNLNTMIGRDVALEIDVSYKIGRSVAVLYKGLVIGHLPRFMAKSAWLHLKFKSRIEGTIYRQLDNGFQNSFCFSSLTRSQEVGIRLRFFFKDHLDGERHISGSSDAKLFLAYIMKHRLNCFPGVTLSNCPHELKDLLS